MVETTNQIKMYDDVHYVCNMFVIHHFVQYGV